MEYGGSEEHFQGMIKLLTFTSHFLVCKHTGTCICIIGVFILVCMCTVYVRVYINQKVMTLFHLIICAEGSKLSFIGHAIS